MEEHTLTIIQLILSTDLAVIQLKDSHLILHISQQHQEGTDNKWVPSSFEQVPQL